jgi:hypothetical protein
MMAKSTTVSKSLKSKPDFPLTARGDGRYCKKARGEMFHFVGAEKEAFEERLGVKDYLLADEEPPAKDDEGCHRQFSDRFVPGAQ